MDSLQIAAITDNFNVTTMLLGLAIVFAVMASVAVAIFAGRKLLSVMRDWNVVKAGPMYIYENADGSAGYTYDRNHPRRVH